MSSDRAQPFTVKVIQDVEEWDAIEPDWDKLYVATPSAAAPLAFGWLRRWWQVYGPSHGPDALRIVTVWRDGQLVGALPLFLAGVPGTHGPRALRFLSTGEAEEEETCPEYLDLLSVPDDREECARLVWDAMSRMTWDQLELLDLAEDSPLIGASGKHPYFVRGNCLIADLVGGFESYLQKLSPNTRQQVRRLIRAGERAGVRFELVAENDVDETFDELIELHQQKWTARGQPGAFGAPRFVQFHRSLIHDWLPHGRVVLAKLSVQGLPVVVLYGFLTGLKFDFYQSGMLEAQIESLASPGILAHVLLMKELAVRGVESYDFLSGSSSYKQRLSTRKKQLVGIRIWRPTVTATRYRTFRMAGRILRGVRRLLWQGKSGS